MLSVTSLVPRPLPAFQCCTLKNGKAWFAKSRAYDRAKALSMNVGGIYTKPHTANGGCARTRARTSRHNSQSRVTRARSFPGRPRATTDRSTKTVDISRAAYTDYLSPLGNGYYRLVLETRQGDLPARLCDRWRSSRE